MKTRSCKNKGLRLQKWMGQQIADLTGLPFGKDQPIRSREASQQGTDVVLDKEARKLFPFSVECKNTETVNFWNSIEQAKSNQQKDTDWILVCKRNREDPVITMDAKVFFEMLRKNKEN